MAIPRYLAMTAAEIAANSPLPPKIAWMACHFSPYTTGLSNRPGALPPDSLLILNDVTPIHGHSLEAVAGQLAQCVEAFSCRGILLDFQRPGSAETAALAAYLVQALPCPVAVSEPYAGELSCPVFLPPPPHHVPLAEYLAPWQGRALWLEQALDAETITLTESGACIAPLPPGERFADGHADDALHCHYQIQLTDSQAVFTLFRTPGDLEALLSEAEFLGVTQAVGLFQELHSQ